MSSNVLAKYYLYVAIRKFNNREVQHHPQTHTHTQIIPGQMSQNNRIPTFPSWKAKVFSFSLCISHWNVINLKEILGTGFL
jgi:hypothetical protein